MKQLTTENISIRFSENINYAWALFNGPVSNDEFKNSLNDKSFRTSLKKSNTTNLLLDCSRLGRFSIPEMSDYLDIDFTNVMANIDVKNVSVLVDENVLSMMQFIFKQIENDHAGSKTHIRFFNSGQFTASSEAIEWFN